MKPDLVVMEVGTFLNLLAAADTNRVSHSPVWSQLGSGDGASPELVCMGLYIVENILMRTSVDDLLETGSALW